MASELFHDLCKAAYVRECPVIMLTTSLGMCFGHSAIMTRVRLAEQLKELGSDFVDTMSRLANQYNPRGCPYVFKCPVCGAADCQSAVQYKKIISPVSGK